MSEAKRDELAEAKRLHEQAQKSEHYDGYPASPSQSGEKSESGLLESAKEFLENYGEPLRIRDGLHKSQIVKFTASFAAEQRRKALEEAAEIADRYKQPLVSWRIRRLATEPLKPGESK